MQTLDKLTEWDHCRRDCVEISCRTSVLSVAPPSCSSVPTPTPGQWPQPEEKKISRKKTREKEPSSWTFTQVHDIQFIRCVICVCYKTILTLMPGWRSCQQMLETRFQCTSHSPCPETIVFRSTWDYFKFSGDVVFIFDPKRCIKKGSPEDNRSAKLPYPDSGGKGRVSNDNEAALRRTGNHNNHCTDRIPVYGHKKPFTYLLDPL